LIEAMAHSLRTLLQKVKRRTWMKFALRGVGPNDNFERLDLAYSIEDPWNMESPGEISRFEGTNRIIRREFGQIDTLLELGCGEGHQTARLSEVAARVFGLDVSEKAVERARKRLPAAQFAATDVFSQPWSAQVSRFDLVTACEVLYYMSDVDRTIARMSELGRHCDAKLFGSLHNLGNAYVTCAKHHICLYILATVKVVGSTYSTVFKVEHPPAFWVFL
jgi:2-polyprenyl-3-methyl-5-hydroxy-6-metoxy-1,4-benzoquinol methylase